MNKKQPILLYPGIWLYYQTFSSGVLSLQHPAVPSLLEINYCKAGQLVWKREDGLPISLRPGNISLHTRKISADSAFTFPDSRYQGLTICIDLQKASENPPELLKDLNLFQTILPGKFRPDDNPAFLTGNEQTEGIFSGFYPSSRDRRSPLHGVCISDCPAEYPQSEVLELAGLKIKTLELLLYLAKTEFTPQSQLTEYPSDLIDVVREIHDQLLLHLEQRITIEELSRQYLLNTTTLKNVFKSFYGTSVAAHIREHRMEQAAKLLRETNKSVAEIARTVGYDSQSRFTAAFKASFQTLPREYRKN